MAVGTVVRTAHHAGEAAGLDAVGEFGLQRVVGAVGGVERRFDSLLLHLAGDDVDDAAHGVGAVEHRCRTAQHFDALGQHRLVGVGNGVAHQSHVLRMAVDQHHKSGGGQSGLGCSAYAAQRELACRTRRHAVAHDAAAGGEESRHLFGQQGQQRLFMALFDLPAVDRRYGHRQVADVGAVAGARDNDAVDGMRPLVGLGCGCFGRQGSPGRKRQQQGCGKKKSFHELFRMKLRIGSRHSSAVRQSRQSVSTGQRPVRARLTICGTSRAHSTSTPCRAKSSSAAVLATSV